MAVGPKEVRMNELIKCRLDALPVAAAQDSVARDDVTGPTRVVRLAIDDEARGTDNADALREEGR